MKTFICTLYFQNIPIWCDAIESVEVPELYDLNKEFGMFGDKLMVREVADAGFLQRLKQHPFVNI